MINATDPDANATLTYELINGFELIDRTSPFEGNVTSSESHSSYPGTLAFDDGGSYSTSRWVAMGTQLPNVWIMYDFDEPTEISGYSIQSQHYRSNERAPKNWTLQGSDDKSIWTIIDSENNQWLGFMGNSIYSVSNPHLSVL